MEAFAEFMRVLGASSLWLAGSGFVPWLCLRCGLQLSPGTRGVASVLIVLQGWIWVGVPVQIDMAWIRPHAASFAGPRATADGSARQYAAGYVSCDSLLPAGIQVFDTPWPGIARARPEIRQHADSVLTTLMPMAGIAAAAIWITGMAIVLGRSIFAFATLSRMVRALPHAPRAWQDEVSELCRSQSIRKAPVLKLSDIASPMLVQTGGRACIVVPAWLWESCTSEQRNSILLHELAHYRRGDLWRQLAMRLLILPHWFNPVAWWAAREFEAASEAACDEAACGGDPRRAISYTKALLVLNERLGIRYAQAVAVSGGSLTERIRRVLHPEFREERFMSRFLILSVMSVLAGLATIRLEAADRSSSAGSETATEASGRQQEGERQQRRQDTARSLLVNGGFEETQEESDDPESWFGTRFPPTAGHHMLTTSTVAHSGKRSVAVQIGESHPERRVDYNWTAVAKGWKAGEEYELSGWIKVKNAERPAVIMVQFWGEEGKNGKMLGGATTQHESPVQGTTDWTKVSTRFVVPQGTGAVRVRAALSSQGNAGAKAWFDDVKLVKAER